MVQLFVRIPVPNGYTENAYGTMVPGSKFDLALPTSKKVRVSVDIQKDKVTIQKQDYDASGNLGSIVNLVTDLKLESTGYNGFGPFVGYRSHGCSELTTMRFLDLEMKYEATAFDALKTTQYYQGAEQKYFINLDRKSVV